MKKTLFALASGLMLCAACMAQDTPKSSVTLPLNLTPPKSLVDAVALRASTQQTAFAMAFGVMANRLPDIVFPAGSARVNNCGKRVLLEELKSFIDRDPTGKVVFVGHITEKEKNSLDHQRAMNSAAVISTGQGICTSFPASQILVSAAGAADNGVDLQPHLCGTSASPRTGELYGQTVAENDGQAKYRRVEVWFVPTGGTLPASLKEYQDASALSVSSLGCPK